MEFSHVNGEINFFTYTDSSDFLIISTENWILKSKLIT